ncbi:hypothetical protein EDB89DRAFT_1904819 [Lactarius sanguifluus]|nr:hypothetical protein EDB89DRAFT_1904819 [Lactarius sanguifluus]
MSPQHHAQDPATTNPPRHDAQDPTANLPPRHLNTVCNAPPSPTPTPPPIHRHAAPTRHARPHHPLTHRHAAPTRRAGLCPPPTRYAAPTPTRTQDPFTADPPRHPNTARKTPPSPTHPHATPTRTQDLVTTDPPRHPNTARKTPPSPTRPHATPTRTQDPATADLPPRLATRLATPPNTAYLHNGNSIQDHPEPELQGAVPISSTQINALGGTKVDSCEGHTRHQTNVSTLQSLVELEQRVEAQTSAMKALRYRTAALPPTRSLVDEIKTHRMEMETTLANLTVLWCSDGSTAMCMKENLMLQLREVIEELVPTHVD